MKAEGEDGLDGRRIVRHLVTAVEDIPSSGETCNSGHVYYVGLPDVLHTIEEAPETSGEWNAWCIPADLIPHGMLLSSIVVPHVSNTCNEAMYMAAFEHNGKKCRTTAGNQQRTQELGTGTERHLGV